MVLLARRRRRRAPAGAPGGCGLRHEGARAVRAAAPAQGRPPQRLPHRPPQGQARHPLDGIRRDPAGGRGGLSGRRRRPRPEADDGAGQPVAVVARRARRRHDAALRQRGDGLRAQPRGFRQDHHRLSPASPAAPEDRAAVRTVAFDVPVCGERHGPRQCRLEGSRKRLAHSHAASEIPRLPRQHSGGDRRHGSARRQRLHRGMGERAADPRRPYRRALGRHQQHQRARYRHPRGRQEPRPSLARHRAHQIAR